MPPRLSWSRLLPGLTAIAVLALMLTGVLVYSGVGRIHGDKVRVHVLTNQARGIMPGSEVWLSGQKVGTVENVSFQPARTDDSLRVVLSTSIRASDARFLRKDARAQVRTGGTVIGPTVVYFEGGSPGAPALRDGDTIRAIAESDLEDATQKLTAAAEQLAPLMTDARAVFAHVRNGSGTVGLLVNDGRMRSGIGELRAQLAGFNLNSAASSARAQVLQRASVTLSRVDSVRAFLSSTSTSLGRFRRDSTLLRALAAIGEDLRSIDSLFHNDSGNLARFQRDSALYEAIDSARREMALLFEDIRNRPLRYLSFPSP